MSTLNGSARELADGLVAEEFGGDGVFPTLVNIYQEQGYEAGYVRGVNDTLAGVLEATEDFVRLRGDLAIETRRLLHAFSEFMESRVSRTPPDYNTGFVGGLGI